jgi:hypothetical protein
MIKRIDLPIATILKSIIVTGFIATSPIIIFSNFERSLRTEDEIR